MNLDEISAGVVKNHRDEPVLLESILKKSQEFGLKEDSKFIDVAGGLGFPFFDLEARGLDVIYSDGSEYAFKKVVQRAIKPQNCYNILWNNLRDKFRNKRFDYILCIGQSLPYCLSWNNLDEKSASRYLVKVFRNFARMAQIGGILHIDYAPQPTDKYILKDNNDLIRVEDKSILVRTLVQAKDNKRILQFNSLEDTEQIQKEGFNITREFLIRIARRNGFNLICEEKLRGDIFNSLFFRKI